MVLKRWVSIEKFLEYLGLSLEDPVELLRTKISEHLLDNYHCYLLFFP